MGFEETVVAGILKNKVSIERKLGFTPTGRLKKDGYLYNLGRTDVARQRIRDFVLSGISGNQDFLDFQLGLRNIVIGNRRVKPVPVNGALEKYFDQYAYDAFNQVDAATNKQLASNLGLKHFIYEGSIIKTSRRFCEKRAGKAFTVEETKKWKNDPDLIDKKTKNAYNPLVDRGRYRCRHFIKYITEGTYKAL